MDPPWISHGYYLAFPSSGGHGTTQLFSEKLLSDTFFFFFLIFIWILQIQHLMDAFHAASLSLELTPHWRLYAPLIHQAGRARWSCQGEPLGALGAPRSSNWNPTLDLSWLEVWQPAGQVISGDHPRENPAPYRSLPEIQSTAIWKKKAQIRGATSNNAQKRWIWGDNIYEGCTT